MQKVNIRLLLRKNPGSYPRLVILKTHENILKLWEQFDADSVVEWWLIRTFRTVFYIYFFSVPLLSVLRSHSVFSSPPQRPMKDFYTRSYPLHYFLILILEKEPVFPFSMLSAKQGNYWYHFYNVFGMTRSLTGDWTRDLPHSMPALYH